MSDYFRGERPFVGSLEFGALSRASSSRAGSIGIEEYEISDKDKYNKTKEIAGTIGAFSVHALLPKPRLVAVEMPKKDGDDLTLDFARSAAAIVNAMAPDKDVSVIGESLVWGEPTPVVAVGMFEPQRRTKITLPGGALGSFHEVDLLNSTVYVGGQPDTVGFVFETGAVVANEERALKDTLDYLAQRPAGPEPEPAQ